MGQKKYFMTLGQKMQSSCGFFHFREILWFLEAFTKNPISRIFFELQTPNFGTREIFTWVKIVVL